MSSDRPHKRRRRRDEDDRDSKEDRQAAISERLKTLIERLGEQSKPSTQDNIHGVAGVLVNDMEEFSSLIIRTIVDCAATKPERTSIYTTLVGLLNATSFDSGKEIIHQLCAKLESSLRTFDFSAAASLVRFLADLGNASVLLPGSLVELLQDLADVTTEADIPQSRSDAYASMVLGVMPWVGRDLAERCTEPFHKLLKSIEDYLKVRSSKHVVPLSVFKASEGVPEQQDSLVLLWQQVSSLHRRDWKENTVERPYIYFDETLVNSLQHSLPKVAIAKHADIAESEAGHYPMPSISFRLYGIADIPETVALPPSRAVERYLYETTVREMLYTYYPDVVGISRQYAELINNKRSVPFNYIIVEVLFGEMFRLPSPRASLVYYFAILAELVRIYVPFAEVLALGMNHIFQRLPQMDVECTARYTKWVAHFLNYYGFKFRWADWFDVVTIEDDMPQSVFVKESLAAMVRLSYHEKIVEEIPQQLEPFMPSKPEPNFKYSSVTAEVKAALCIDELTPLIRAKNTPTADITALLNKIELPKSLSDAEDGLGPEERLAELRLDVFASCMLQLGSKTISHLGIVLNRQLATLQEICNSPQTKGQLVRIVADFWQNNSQMVLIALDKLLSHQIVDTAAIVEWVFSPRTVETFSRHFIWDSLFNMLDFCEQDTIKAKSQFTAEKKDLEALTQKLEDIESKSEDDADQLSAQDATVEKCREVYLQKQQLCKETMSMVFQHFSAVLNERLASRDDEIWIKTATARFLQVGRRYLKLLRESKAMDNIATTIEEDLHSDAAVIVDQIKVMYAM